MATDSNGLVYQNRTLQFYGTAYGDSNVSLTATINGNTVFSGEVPTINSPMPPPPHDLSNNILFSIENSSLFPTNYAGSYPMSIKVTGGYVAVFGLITCNYMAKSLITVMANSSISGNVLTVGKLNLGTIAIGQLITGKEVVANTVIESGADSTWIVNNSQTVTTTTIFGDWHAGHAAEKPGVVDEYQQCYKGDPANSEDTPDARSSVTIDGIAQVPPFPKSRGVWQWAIPNGSTITYDLNISAGSCAQS